MLAADNVRPIKADVLVMDSPLLGFNTLIKMDIIRMLGGVHINQSGNAPFTRMELYACTAIRIEELNFSADFNKQTRAWTASWKWLGNQLTNKVPDYSVSAQVQEEYCHELETWLNNG